MTIYDKQLLVTAMSGIYVLDVSTNLILSMTLIYLQRTFSVPVVKCQSARVSHSRLRYLDGVM